ncbi:MAG: DUF3800 domain-containing protein [Planctomycetota bacterium]
MWCFFDESYPPEGGVTSVVACLMRNETVRELDQIIYRARQTHFGRKHARNLQHELKGKNLLSATSFRMAEKHGYSVNHSLVQDVLAECAKIKVKYTILVFGAAVYGAQDILKRVGEEKLAFPIVEVLKRVSAAAAELAIGRTVNLVFDEKLADRDAAIAIRRFVSGVKLPNVSHYPLIGVSHVSPGIQLADIGAYILGRRAAGDRRFTSWMTKLRNLEWSGQVEGRERMGIQRWDTLPNGQARVRKTW